MTIFSSIPITQLGTQVSVIIPFSFSLPSYASSSQRSSGRSLSSESEEGSLPTRGELYNALEDYVASMLGLEDGHACLLRAMCEVSSNPLHDEGLLGQ